MALRNFEIKKQGEGFLISEQEGSNYHREVTVHEAADRHDASDWLRSEGGAPDLVEEALDQAQQSGQAFVQMVGNYSEADNFPKLNLQSND